MIVYVIMYGSGQQWFEPVDTDSPPIWFRADEYTITNGESQEESKE